MNKNEDPSFDFDDPVEQRLHRLRPAKMPPELMLRLESERPRKLSWLAYAAAPLAAAAVLMVAFFIRSHDDNRTGMLAQNDTNPAGEISDPSDLRVFMPVEEKSTLVAVSELGVIRDDPSRPVRMMRYQWVDDTTYRGDDGRSTFHRSEPRDQIIPVALEVF